MNINSASSMSRMSYQIFHTSQNNALFNNIINQSSNPISLFGSTSSTLANQSYGDLQSALSKQLDKQKQFIKDLDTYNTTSTKFYNDYVPAMKNLKDSASDLTNTLANTDATTDSIVTKVKAFAKDYNSTVNFLNDNRTLSNKVANLAESFASPKYNGRALSAIGIEVDNKGSLSIDESKLTNALTNDPSKVKEILGGSNGLASKSAQKAEVALHNPTDLIAFPKNLNTSTNGLMQGYLLDLYA